MGGVAIVTVGVAVVITAACTTLVGIDSEVLSDGGAGQPCGAATPCGAGLTCVARVCAPAADAADDSVSGDDGPPAPVTLASAQGMLGFIAVDSSNVYWPDGNKGVLACAIGGCSSPRLLAGGAPSAVVVDATYAYWTEFTVPGSVRKTALADGATTVLASGLSGAQAAPYELAIDDTTVYWTNYETPGSVLACAKTGCNGTPTVLASDQDFPQGIAVDATNVYWANAEGGSVARCAKTGCGDSPTVMASGLAFPIGVALDGGYLYWTNRDAGQIMRCAVAGCNGSPTLVASKQPESWGIVVVGGTMYFTDDTADGQVLRCSADACAPTPIATGLALPIAIAVDPTSVYWTNSGDGTVMKAPR